MCASSCRPRKQISRRLATPRSAFAAAINEFEQRSAIADQQRSRYPLQDGSDRATKFFQFDTETQSVILMRYCRSSPKADHSERKAITGETRADRSAGAQLASTPMQTMQTPAINSAGR